MDASRPVVFVVDDDRHVRTALARLLRSAAYETSTFSSVVEFLAAHEPYRPGCVILDLTMPDCDGLAVQKALMGPDGPLRPVIFLTANGSIDASVRAIKSGAVNFLIKPVEEAELFAAVDEALRLDAAQRAQASFRRHATSRLRTLSPRERQVLEYLLDGRLNKQIAAELGTAAKTVKVHRGRVMRKMGVRSVAELVGLAAEAGVHQKRVLRTLMERSIRRWGRQASPRTGDAGT